MSSSQHPSKDNNAARSNRFTRGETGQSTYPRRDRSDRNVQQSGNQRMFSYPDDVDGDLPNEIVAQLDARQSNLPDDDDLIYSDAVQDAFKKYQNEQEEMFAQMEECWNYMNQETERAAMPNTTVRPSNQSQLNPDAIVFQPVWSNSTTTTTTTTNNVQQGFSSANRSTGNGSHQ